MTGHSVVTRPGPGERLAEAIPSQLIQTEEVRSFLLHALGGHAEATVYAEPPALPLPDLTEDMICGPEYVLGQLVPCTRTAMDLVPGGSTTPPGM